MRGSADVFVCDGFTGNILLKYGESMYDFLKAKLPDDPEVENFNFERVGGLPLIGVRGNVLIGHGISGPLAFANMLYRAVDIARANLVAHLEAAFSALNLPAS